MRRLILSLAFLLTVPANADGLRHFQTAFDAAQDESYAEYVRFRERHDIGRFDLSAFETDGTVTHLALDGSTFTFVVELIAIYDLRSETCSWAFDVDLAPNVPRTAALAVREVADANDWPQEIMAQWPMRQGICILRSNTATLIGDLDFISFQVEGDVAYIFGAAGLEALS
ncbi:DUF6882 domain-containing protein [Hasllibacter sp. MH4015]|uniref:DUF6882 domain-containing protein n=1 Tax=Hasllibacter sp. MH4015 TaxID=2854029 RepID=UPI001CD34591|nr:DUF6882 domain-containing protein [Hasllibacter sp. MH4015]